LKGGPSLATSITLSSPRKAGEKGRTRTAPAEVLKREDDEPFLDPPPGSRALEPQKSTQGMPSARCGGEAPPKGHPTATAAPSFVLFIGATESPRSEVIVKRGVPDPPRRQALARAATGDPGGGRR